MRRWPRADLRVGNDDRQRVVDELQRHYIAGRLSSEELGERVSAALAARTFGDLAVILSDLPPDPASVQDEQPNGRPHETWFAGPPLGLILVVVGLLLLVTFTLGGGLFGAHTGPWSFWPFLWVFFFFGWPRGGRRRHF